MGIWQNLWRYLLSWSANFNEYQRMGFSARTYNNDFILCKRFEALGLILSVYQGIEPHNPKFKDFVDFSIPDACLVIEGIKSHPELRAVAANHFEHIEIRDDYLFAYTRYLDLDDQKMKQSVIVMDEAIQALLK